MSGDHAHHPNYTKIWAILLALLVISVLGPMIGVQAITLITAFGIACVKAYLVAKHFMHINLAKKFVSQIVVLFLAFMVLLFFGVAPDVMKDHGQGWEKTESWHAEDSAHAAEGNGGH